MFSCLAPSTTTIIPQKRPRVEDSAREREKLWHMSYSPRRLDQYFHSPQRSFERNHSYFFPRKNSDNYSPQKRGESQGFSPFHQNGKNQQKRSEEIERAHRTSNPREISDRLGEIMGKY